MDRIAIMGNFTDKGTKGNLAPGVHVAGDSLVRRELIQQFGQQWRIADVAGREPGGEGFQ